MTKQNPIFTPDQLAVITDVVEAKLNFDTPLISAVFKPKMDNYTDEKWDEAMGILHPVLPLDMDVVDGEYVYKPYYQDEEALTKSASIYVAMQEYQDNLIHSPKNADLYYYGSASNKETQLEHLNKFFNVVRFSTKATGPFWYGLEVAISEADPRGYEVLSQYITPRRMVIKNPQWIENGRSFDNSVGPIICYDFGSDKDYHFFKKIAADLENYQKQKAEYENPTQPWEPKRLLAYGMKMDKQYAR